MTTAIIVAGVIVAVVIGLSMPTVRDYRMELKSINHQLSRIGDALNRLVILVENKGETDGQR